MRIGIIGAGSMGAILARHLSELGHHVSIANSRGPESLAAADRSRIAEYRAEQEARLRASL